MKPIGINAPKPTAGSIIRFFQLSGKRHLLLTGGRGSGKTTLLRDLLPLLSATPVPGIITQAQPKEAVFLRDALTGESVQIGRYREDLPGTENKMVPVWEGFQTLGLSALADGIQNESPWFFIDEIGYLEGSCGEYCRGIEALMEHKRLAAVIRKQELPFLTGLLRRGDVCVVDLDAPFPVCGCVIMASGLGTRFGGNKLLADFREKPLLEWILDTTDGLFAKRVVVTRHKEVENLCHRREIPVILHDLPHRSDTIRLGLGAMGDSVSSCLFCPGDQPLLSRETLETLLLSAAVTPETIWQLSYENTPSAPSLFPSWAFEELKALPEGKGGSVLTKQYADRLRYVPAQSRYECFDVDSPEDLEELLNHSDSV